MSDQGQEVERKTCKLCGESKPPTEFYVEKRAQDGLRSRCKACVLTATNAYKKRNPDKVRELSRRHRERNPEVAREEKRRWARNNPEKRRQLRNEWRAANREKSRAHSAVARALKGGTLKKSSTCEDCGTSGRIEAHHDDYSRPLDVRWLCARCHRSADRRRAAS